MEEFTIKGKAQRRLGGKQTERPCRCRGIGQFLRSAGKNGDRFRLQRGGKHSLGRLLKSLGCRDPGVCGLNLTGRLTDFHQ